MDTVANADYQHAIYTRSAYGGNWIPIQLEGKIKLQSIHLAFVPALERSGVRGSNLG